MAEKQSHKERLKEITDSIEAGIKELFESDRYKSYLQTMSRFHKYSLNNTLLISMQKPNATHVAGFNKWRDGFSRFVKKGEKGIKIIAPIPYKIKEEREKLDPQTKAPLLDASGKVQTEEVEIQIPMFRVVSVFDVSQTEGEPLPTLSSNLNGSVKQFDAFMESIKRTAPVLIEIMPLPESTDGYYHTEEKRIAIREGMSEVQTVSAAIHEVAHSLLHNKETEKELQAQQDENAKPLKPKSRNTEEVEAESISFAVCSYYGIQTAENSLGYIATWSKGKELAELRASLETINKTSSKLISSIDTHFAEIVKERGIDLTLPTEQQDPLEKLASDIDAFVAEFDPYEYADQVKSSEVHISEIKSHIVNGKLSEIREYLKDIAEDAGEYSVQANGLLDELSTYEFENYPKELAYKIDDSYFSIFEVEDGYEYSLYDSKYNLLDGGVYDDHSITIFEATYEVAELKAVNFPFEVYAGAEKVNFAELTEKSQEVESGKIKGIKFEQKEASKKVHNVEQSKVIGTVKYRDVANEFTKSSPQFIDRDMPLYTNRDGEQFVFGYGSTGNGTTVWNYLDETGDDYTTVAHISSHGKLTYFVDNLPETAKEALVEMAKELGNQYNYPLPDPTISKEDISQYGYTADELLPLSKERAIELFEQDLTVYLLYEDNTEVMAFERADIDQHDGLCGIEKVDWLALQEFEEVKGDGNISQEIMERLFLEKGKDAYAIYQLKGGADLRDYRFEGLDWLKSRGLSVERKNYHLVYTDTFSQFSGTRDRLEELWDKFNIDHPADFTGHSLSVSDIVAIKKSNVVSYHYCDSYDFVELTNFAKLLPDNFLTGGKIETPRGSFSLTTMTTAQMEQAGYGYHHTSDDGVYRIMANGTRAFAVASEDNPFRTAELSTEQNYNQIDGIINNQPTVTELERDAKSGKPIALMDLLDATRREDKQSVIQQLKAKPQQEKEKSKKVPSIGTEMER